MSTKESVKRTICRNDPGTKREEWCNWETFPFAEMDSILNVQQWIQQCIHQDPKDIEMILACPKGVEEGVWKYEHLRQFCMELNGLAVLLQEECKPETCTQMTATDQWIFLCAAHKTPKECSAIDYTRHTLDGAAALLNSGRYFANRMNIKDSSIAKISSICRRVYRIFSHAYFHHKKTIFDPFENGAMLAEALTQVYLNSDARIQSYENGRELINAKKISFFPEGFVNETFLCRRFTTFVMRYSLMEQEHLIVPILPEQSSNNSIVSVTTSA